jgi:hypothetical protein
VRKEHVPKTSTLLHLADFLETPREQVLAMAAGLPYARAGEREVPACILL